MPNADNRDIHRIGGATVENLRLKAREAELKIPGISVLRSGTPAEAAQQIRAAFPRAKALHEAAALVASTSARLLRSVGFDIIAAPSKALPNHCRLVHPTGVVGFNDVNLERLAQIFVTTTGQ